MPKPIKYSRYKWKQVLCPRDFQILKKGQGIVSRISALHDADGNDLGHNAAETEFVGDADNLVDVFISFRGLLGD